MRIPFVRRSFYGCKSLNVKWLQHGDKNTRYFHGTTITRWRKNHVEVLQDADGTWVHDRDMLEVMVTNFYGSFH